MEIQYTQSSKNGKERLILREKDVVVQRWTFLGWKDYLVCRYSQLKCDLENAHVRVLGPAITLCVLAFVALGVSRFEWMPNGCAWLLTILAGMFFVGALCGPRSSEVMIVRQLNVGIVFCVYKPRPRPNRSRQLYGGKSKLGEFEMICRELRNRIADASVVSRK